MSILNLIAVLRKWLVLLCATVVWPSCALTIVGPWYQVHGQSTILTQYHGPFHSAYSGVNSLSADSDLETTYTATLFTGSRLWKGAGFYWDPEATAGGGLSGGSGLGGVTNGEVTRVGTRALRIYTARLYLRQAFDWGGSTQTVEDSPHQLAGVQHDKRLVWTLGKYSAEDIFDANRYSHDPRGQFMNWGLMANAAWDYPADTRGYTWGAAVEWVLEDWTWRAGGFLEPEEANGPHIEADPTRARGEVTELERRYSVGKRAGAVRILGFWNQADMGHYRTTLNTPAFNLDVTQSRRPGTQKYGFGLSGDQEIASDLGAFCRLGWDDGHSETWAFDEVDRTVSAGLSLQGNRWKRPSDVVGAALLINGLSNDHRDYIAAGGNGFQLGDGRLDYGTEHIIEIYYLFKILSALSLTADFQGIQNPGYNRDRGPVAVWSGRLHVEF